MRFKEKFLIQVVICLVIFAGIRCAGMLDVKPVKEVKAFIGEHFQQNYTTKDIKNAGSQLLREAETLHTTVTSAVVKANQLGEDDKTLGKADQNGIQMVYAVNSGNVTAAGIDKKMGKFIKIKTDKDIETYGNFCEITVLTGDKVRRGDIIGTFDSSGKDEFIYQKS